MLGYASSVLGRLQQAYVGSSNESRDVPSESTLEALCDEVERASSEIALSRDTYLARFRENERGRVAVTRFAANEERDRSIAALVELRLSWALDGGETKAMRAMDDRYVRGVERALVKFKLDEAAIEDVMQRVRHKLFVRDDQGKIRVLDYAGEGRLRALVQVAATREALDSLRRPRETEGEDDLLALPSGEVDPEIATLKARLGGEFKSAFEAAVKRLSSRERNLLRMHIVTGVPLEQLATMYSVHRATIVRWMAAAREALLKALMAELTQRTGARGAEIGPLVDLVRSRLDLSLERWWKSTHASQSRDSQQSSEDVSNEDDALAGQRGGSRRSE
jgi:RNA polymerase sigma-70 factor, ECF subfamily